MFGYVRGKLMVCNHLVKQNSEALADLKSKETIKYSFDFDNTNLIFD